LAFPPEPLFLACHSASFPCNTTHTRQGGRREKGEGNAATKRLVIVTAQQHHHNNGQSTHHHILPSHPFTPSTTTHYNENTMVSHMKK
jgi:hypothetical protein